MKKYLKTEYLPWLTLGFGALGFLLGLIAVLSGPNEGESWLIRLSWILTALFAVMLWRLTRELRRGEAYSFNFPPSLFGAIGAAVAAVGISVNVVMKIVSMGDFLVVLDIALGLAAAASFVFLASCRKNGRQPSFLFYCIICVYLMIDLVCLYRLRSADPHIWRYCFSLLASVGLMLCSYYDASFAAGECNRRTHAASHLATIYLCMLCLPWDENPIFYLSLGIWLFSDLCNLSLVTRRKPDFR